MPLRSSLAELSPKDLCGCGSQKRYAVCCKGKRLKFLRDEDGKLVRSVPIHPRLKSELRRWESEFLGVYGRKPVQDDRVLFTQFQFSEQQFNDAMRKIGEKAGVRPEMIFATQRTGRIVAQTNVDLIPDNELAEWEAAVGEYKALLAAGVDPFFVFTYLKPNNMSFSRGSPS